MSNKEMPKLLKIIGIGHYVGAVLSILFAVAIFTSQSLRNFLIKIDFNYLFVANPYWIGIISMPISILSFFIARELFLSKKWVKNILIIEYSLFGILWIIQNIVYFSYEKVSSIIITVGVLGFILHYLVTNEKVKDFLIQP